MSGASETVWDANRQRFLESRLQAMGVEPSAMDRAGTTVVPEADRAGSNRAVCYQVGKHTLLPCDPAVADLLGPLASAQQSLADDEFRRWTQEAGGSLIGQAVMKTQMCALPDLGDSPGRAHRFDWSNENDLELIQELISVSSEDDLDESEVSMGELDDRAVGLLEAGCVQAYASSRPFEDMAEFGDIGVLVRAGGRSAGWGRAVVAFLITEILEPAGVIPLYRCDHLENPGSDRLSAALGFEPALSLSAAEFPGG